MNREQLLERLTALDFLAVDMGLYLNTHPYDTDAIAEYNKIVKTADMVREKYESLYGPLCSFRSISRDPNHWQWSNDPWPWDESFNFNLSKERCL